jgi:enoyl-CoA hydratase/carnithine racemase
VTAGPVRYDVADSIATITLDRPERRNAWSLEVADALSDALEAAAADVRARAVVVTGAGPVFSVGADLAGGDLRDPGEHGDPSDPSASAPPPEERPRRWPFEVPKPVIAALNGHAIGAGISVSMLCDIRVVAAEAKVGFVFVRRGVIGEMGVFRSLARAAGSATATDLLLSGRIVSGSEAETLGVCNTSVSAAEVLPTARRIASEIAAECSPASVAITKKLLWEDFATTFVSHSERERALFEWCAVSGEMAEGVASFVEHRRPDWKQDPFRDLPRDLL